ncbi:MAG: PEP-CTERM sorting domain-containing protein [Gemmatimonadales bacterium]
MQVPALVGLLAGAGLLAVTPGDATADLRTNASGRWVYVSALSADFGRLAGSPALVLQSGSVLANMAGMPAVFSNGEEEEDDDEGGSVLSSQYVVVLAGIGGAALVASELMSDDAGNTALSSNPTPPGGNPPGGGLPNDPPLNQTPPETTTPEPVTMTLLATGLAGLGGAQIRRRRQRQEA